MTRSAILTRRMIAMLGALLFAAAGAALAQIDKEPVMLVARPGLEPPYGETVLIAIPSGNSEHAGFIVNRPLRQTLATLFPDRPEAKNSNQPVRLGGPVMLDTMFAVVRTPAGDDGATVPLFEDVRMAVRAETIKRIVERRPDDARYFIGFVSWAPGELSQEIASGYWYVMRPRGDVLFREDPDALWSDLVRRARAASDYL